MVNNYYQKQKEKLQKKVRERYQNLPEEQKQQLLEYMKNYYVAHKNVTCLVA